MSRPKLDMSDFIDSNVDLFMQSILHEKTDVWTGPKLQFAITMQ